MMGTEEFLRFLPRATVSPAKLAYLTQATESLHSAAGIAARPALPRPEIGNGAPCRPGRCEQAGGWPVPRLGSRAVLKPGQCAIRYKAPK